MWLPLNVAEAEECDVNTDVVSAYGALLTNDTGGARAGLDAAERHLGCGPVVDPQALGRLWLVEGALFLKTGEDDPDSSFSAAHRVAPDLWLSELGGAARARWEAATTEPGTATLVLDIAVRDRRVAVDGAPWDGGPVAPGLHAVQVSEAVGPAVFGTVLYAGAGTATTVATGLPPEPERAVTSGGRPRPAPRSSRSTPAPGPERHRLPLPDVTLRMHALVGLSLSHGEALEVDIGSDTFHEPPNKFVPSLELAAGVVLGPGWARVQGGPGLLVGGAWLGRRSDGTLSRTPVTLDLAVAGGASLHGLLLGGATGLAWPGRLTERLVVGKDLPGALSAEARLGFDVASERPVEPALELLGGVRF